MHVRAVDILGVHDAASLRYQSVTLFLRGKCTFCIFNYPFLLFRGLETLLLNQPLGNNPVSLLLVMPD